MDIDKGFHRRLLALTDFLDAQDKVICDKSGLLHKILPALTYQTAGVDALVAPEFDNSVSLDCDKVVTAYSEDVVDFFKVRGFALTQWNVEMSVACFERLTPHKLAEQFACTGCGACANVCPRDAIDMTFDDAGFLKPHINDKCINCQRCVKTCPAAKPARNSDFSISLSGNISKNLPLACYAVWADDDTRMHSSSGGMFSVIAKFVLERGGRVFGAVWTEDFFCNIQSAASEEEILPMRYSKYVQSNTQKTFREVKDLLAKNILVAYFGLPCQIAGLKAYLGDTRGLITVDSACYFAPSNVLFRKFLDEQFGLDKVENVVCRDKAAPTNWSSKSMRIDFKGGDSVYPDWRKNPYIMAFTNLLTRNDTCQNCQFCNFPRVGDFTVGDFWGAPANWKDKKGTSVVFLNTQSAQNVFNALSKNLQRFEAFPLQTGIAKNRIGRKSKPLYPPARMFFRKLIKKFSFQNATDRALTNHHDIGFVAWFNHNLGNNLTNYALWQYLTDIGNEVLIITNPREKIRSTDNRFWRFLKNPFPNYAVNEQVVNYDDYKKLNDICDCFVVGSDQNWRWSGKNVLMKYFAFCDWVEDDKYKISYAASFGSAGFTSNADVRQNAGQLLNRFQSISVREDSGVEILKKVFGLRGEQVLDPVFLPDVKYYETMAANGRLVLPEKFVGAYFLDPDEGKANALKSIGNRFSGGVYHATGAANEYLEMSQRISLEEWIATVRYSEYFLTDSKECRFSRINLFCG